MASEPELRSVLDGAGQAIFESQVALGGVDAGLALGEAELEIKTTVQSREGRLFVEPISAGMATSGAITPGLVSTVKVRYVAVAAPPRERVEPPAPEATSSAAVLREVEAMSDIRKLSKIYGRLSVKAYAVPDARRWLVVVADPAGTVLRELVRPMEA